MTGIEPMVSPLRLVVPPALVSWAGTIAEINIDLSEDGLLLKDGYHHDGLGPVSLYGGMAPVPSHVDVREEELAGRIPHPVWGFVLSCPEGELHWKDGCAPIGAGCAYVVDPSVPHGVTGPEGHIAFLATWDYDPIPVYGDLARFASCCLALAEDLRRQEPDAVRFVERELGMEGELC